MALEKSIELESGITLPNAYFRITEFFVDYENKNVGMQLACYVNSSARFDGKKPIKVTPYQIFHNPMSAMTSQYQLTMPYTSDLILKVSLDGNGIIDVEVEGQSVEEIANELNASEVFSEHWVASQVGEYIIILESKIADSTYNKLAVSGSVDVFDHIRSGSAEKASDFDTFFVIEQLDNQGINPIKQCYEYLKTLDEFEDAIDVV